MKPLVVAFAACVAAIWMFIGTALAEPPSPSGAAAAPSVAQADTSQPGAPSAPPAVKPEQAPAMPPQSEAQKPTAGPGWVGPPAVIFLKPRLADVQAVRARQLLPVQRGGGVGAADGAPVVAADGLGLELQRVYAGDGGGGR